MTTAELEKTTRAWTNFRSHLMKKLADYPFVEECMPAMEINIRGATFDIVVYIDFEEVSVDNLSSEFAAAFVVLVAHWVAQVAKGTCKSVSEIAADLIPSEDTGKWRDAVDLVCIKAAQMVKDHVNAAS